MPERERKRPRAKKEAKKGITTGRAYVQSTFNNTMVTLTDPRGNVLSWGSSGTAGFKGSRKGTPYAAQFLAAPRGGPQGYGIWPAADRDFRERSGQWARGGDSLSPELWTLYYEYHRRYAYSS